MRKTIAILLAVGFLALLLPMSTAREAKAATDLSNIRVLLTMGSPQTVTMAVSGSYFLNENGASFKNGTLTLRASGGKVQVSHSNGGTLYTGSSVNIMRERIDPSAGYMRFAAGNTTRSYLGHFKVSASGAGLRVVNTVPLAHYLYGVVRGEMSNTFPMEALKAQSIAAKCYVLANMTGGSDYDIGDTASDQVYKGYVASETNVHRAVDATYDQFLYLGNSILCAYFAASNGGYTQLPSEIWTGTNRYQWDRAYRSGVEDPYDVRNPESMQEAVLLPFDGDNSRDMTSVLSAFLRGLATTSLREGVSYIESIDNFRAYYGTSYSYTSAASRNPNCEITMTVTLESGRSKEVTIPFEAMMFNWNGVWRNQVSTSLRLVTVSETRDGFYVYHGRYGHGVGLSQRGAQQMANEGWNYQKILEFYYPGADLKTMRLSAPQDPTNPGGSGSTGDPVDTSTPPPADGSSIGSGATGEVIVAMADIRSRAGGGVVTVRAPQRVVLDILGEEGDYYYIYVQGYSGYILKSDVQIINSGTGSGSGSSSPSSGLTAIGQGETIGSVNFRSGPSTGTKIISTLNKGVKFEFYSKSNGWYHVKVDGQEGYLNATYIKETSASSGTSSPSQPSGSSSSGITGYGELTTSNVNFRSAPNTSSSSVIKKLSKGTAVSIYAKSGDWYHVNIAGTDGYVSAQYIKTTAAPSGAAPNTSTPTSGTSSGITAYGETIGNVNFRTKPGTGADSTVMRQLSRGTKVNIYSKSGDWYHVEVNGTDGYLSAQYVKQTGIANNASSNTSSAERSWTGIVVNEWVWLRSTGVAIDSSNTIRQLQVGTQLTVLSQTSDFYKVVVDGQEGFAHKDYISILYENTGSASQGTSDAGGTKSGVTTAEVRLRSSATTETSSNIITTLSPGTPLTIHGDNGYGWYEVTAGGKRGYVSGLYVRIT